MKLKETVYQTIIRHEMISSGSTVVAALSGGSDSMALLTVLNELADELGFTLSALHIHHGIRATSDDEAVFVKNWCETANIPLKIVSVDAPAYAKEHRMSLEMAARELRYQVFETETPFGAWIATAHHMDDRMETFFINLSRGCGTKGLCSIPYRRDRLIRPMLDASKELIFEYLTEKNIPYCEDESNRDTRFLRNFFRHEILSKIKARQDINFTHNFADTLQNLSEEQAYLDSAAKPYQNENRAEILASLPRPILWRVLSNRNAPLQRAQFERLVSLLATGNFKEQLSDGWFAVCKNGEFSFERPEMDPPIPLTPLEDAVSVDHKIITTDISKEFNSPFTTFSADYDTINSKLYVRSRQSGDRFTHPYRGWTKSLKKLFSEDHVNRRNRQIVVTDEQNRIIFVEGYGVNAPFIPTKNTVNFLHFIINKENEK